jgi:hypothetical protein
MWLPRPTKVSLYHSSPTRDQVTTYGRDRPMFGNVGCSPRNCVGSTISDERLPSNPPGARQWEKFGDPTTPRLGAIRVF